MTEPISSEFGNVPNIFIPPINESKIEEEEEEIEEEIPTGFRGFLYKTDNFLRDHYRLMIISLIIVVIGLIIIIIKVTGFRKAKKFKRIKEEYNLSRSQARLLNQKLLYDEQLDNLKRVMNKTDEEDKTALIEQGLMTIDPQNSANSGGSMNRMNYVGSTNQH